MSLPSESPNCAAGFQAATDVPTLQVGAGDGPVGRLRGPDRAAFLARHDQHEV